MDVGRERHGPCEFPSLSHADFVIVRGNMVLQPLFPCTGGPGSSYGC